MTEEKRKKIGIELLPSLKKRLKQRALALDRPMWQITQEALECYLDGEREETIEDPHVTRARRILELDPESKFRLLVDAFYAEVVKESRSNGPKGRKRAG